MKKHIWNLLFIFLLAGVGMSSCKDEYKSSLNLTADVKIQDFTVNEVKGVIDEKNKTITVTLESGSKVDVASISPQIVLPAGAEITPAITTGMDFTNPKEFTVVNGDIYTKYTISVSEKFYFAFLGEPASISAMTNLDDKIAAEWFLSKYPSGEYISFSQIAAGTVDLKKYNAIWFHSDQGTRPCWPDAQMLYGIADNSTIVSKLKAYYENGGNLLLTNFAGSLVDELGIVSDPKYAPNNAFGDVTANPDSQNWGDWDLKWYASLSSPLASGLNFKNDDPTKFIMLPNGVARRNRTNQYNIDNWTDYAGGGATIADRIVYFEKVNNCKILVTNWNSIEINMVLWEKRNSKGTVIFIGSGTYDWYAENGVINSAGNREKLTSNSLAYLLAQSKK